MSSPQRAPGTWNLGHTTEHMSPHPLSLRLLSRVISLPMCDNMQNRTAEQQFALELPDDDGDDQGEQAVWA